MCIQSWELIRGRLFNARNSTASLNCLNKHQCSPHSGASCTVRGLCPPVCTPRPGNGNCRLLLGKHFWRLWIKYGDKNKMRTLGCREKGGWFSHSSSLLDRTDEMPDAAFIPKVHLSLCLGYPASNRFAKLLWNPVWMLFSWFNLGLCLFSFLPTFAKSIWDRVKSTYECPCNLIKSTDVANVTDCN